ncbi:hypothetical protein [Polyangium jinanense]|uniref:Uncharacterized protein n=1 Tax=Polyangium jinanense TaxID=2829994 RepID=A0A9X4AW64_9BACT|nr:hypothetical protein [Polyangium jinanense]MDC3957514.1 hypothetical protein [Polyangium jinanense]MDC3984995.1 hypothetical protein [Polyangium jinanense]
MQRTMLGFLGIGALVFAGLGACGGKVVIDADGSGGAGGTGSAGNGSAGTNTTTSSSGAGGGDLQSLCQAACASMSATPGCAEDDCVADCVKEFEDEAGPCLNEVTALLECVIKNSGLNGECFSSVCFPFVEALEACETPSTGCSSALCSEAEDGSCSCEGQCNGSAVATECFPQPGTTQVCVCSINGMQVGKCEATLGSFPCSVTEGCCAQFFLQ